MQKLYSNFQVDRTSLDTCETDAQMTGGLNYSALNCRIFRELDYNENCSINPFFGIKSNKRPCLPKDLLNYKYVLEDGLSGNVSDSLPSNCKEECVTMKYDIEVNNGSLDLVPLDQFFKSKLSHSNPKLVSNRHHAMEE